MILSKAMRAAINQYYAHRRNGVFEETATKARCMNALGKAARASKLSLEIPPGTIFIRKGKQSIRLDGPVWMDEANVKGVGDAKK